MTPERQLFFTLPIFTAFLLYANYVRQGKINGNQIFFFGALLGIAALGTTTAMIWPLHADRDWPKLALTNAMIISLATVWCVFFAWRQARVVTAFTATSDGVTIKVISATAWRTPAADAMLLPNTTALRAIAGPSAPVLLAAGKAVEGEVRALAPVKLEKVVSTAGGSLPVGKIYHVAVNEPSKTVDAARLRRGIEHAAQQARKGDAKTIIVPYLPLRGLSPKDGAVAVVEGTLHSRKGFTEILLVAIDPRDTALLKAAVEAALAPS